MVCPALQTTIRSNLLMSGDGADPSALEPDADLCKVNQEGSSCGKPDPDVGSFHIVSLSTLLCLLFRC